jgi:hypothetical protein
MNVKPRAVDAEAGAIDASIASPSHARRPWMSRYPCPIRVEAEAIEWVTGHGTHGIQDRFEAQSVVVTMTSGAD